MHSLCVGWRNLPTLRVGWRNFFSSCAVVSVFCSGEKQVLVLHTTYVLRGLYHTVVVLCQFFWFWREIVFGVTYVLSVQYSCAVVLVFWLWRQLSVWRVRDRYYDWKKKRYSRLSGGCAIIITTGKKKDTVVCLAGARSCLSFLSRSLYLYQFNLN